jgi:uncharacterized membrane protein
VISGLGNALGGGAKSTPTAAIVGAASAAPSASPSGTAIAGAAAAPTSTLTLVAPSAIPTSAAAASDKPANTPRPTNTTVPPTPTRTATAGPQTYALNQLVSVKNWDLAIQKVETPGKELVWSKFDNKSTAAGTWVVVVVDMKNTGNQNFGVNSSDFELRSGNSTYKVSDDIGTYGYSEFKGGQRMGGQVPPGVNVTYYIVFDVAPNAADLQFTFKQDKKPVFTVGNAFAGNAPVAAAPTTAPASGPANGQAYGLNELASVKNWDLAIQKIEKPGKDLIWSQYGNKSTAAGTWFVVVVDMKNTGNQNFGVNSSDFELRSGNVTYKVSDDFGSYSYSDSKGGQKVGGQVPPGVSVTYYIVFDVAPNATDLQFVFKQDKKPVFTVGNATP